MYSIKQKNLAWESASWEVRVGANPFCRGDTLPYADVISVAIERQEYGPVSNKQLRELAGFVFFGIIGAAIGASTNEDLYASILQLRWSDGQPEPVLIRQAFLGDARVDSRATMDAHVANSATMELLFEVAQRRAAQGTFAFPVERRTFYDEGSAMTWLRAVGCGAL